MIQKATCVFVFVLVYVLANAESTYYPFTPNVRYQYRVQATRSIANEARDFNASAAIVRMEAQTLQGQKVFPERYELDGQIASFSFVCEDHTGVYYMASKEPHAVEPRMTKPFQYLIRYPLQIGTRWTQPSLEFDLLNDNRKLPVDLKADIAATQETVIVPAGSFSGCLKINLEGKTFDQQFHIQKNLWYAPGVGLIKSIQREERTGGSARFSLVMLLENFRYEKQHSSASPKLK